MQQFPFQPRDDEGPVFKEPWEAQVFGMVVALHEIGALSWQEWATTLSAEITLAQQQGDPDLGNTYYQHWLGALEKIATVKGFSTSNEISARAEQWREAYLNTPHGKPIVLNPQNHQHDPD